jgi:hypothetical protein
LHRERATSNEKGMRYPLRSTLPAERPHRTSGWSAGYVSAHELRGWTKCDSEKNGGRSEWDCSSCASCFLSKNSTIKFCVLLIAGLPSVRRGYLMICFCLQAGRVCMVAERSVYDISPRASGYLLHKKMALSAKASMLLLGGGIAPLFSSHRNDMTRYIRQ